jgi:hypothetical protein
MKRPLIRCGVAVGLALLAASMTGAAGAHGQQPTRINDVALELVGQVINSAPGVTPATSIQYGYVSQLDDLAIFNAGAQNESTARLTFYTDTVTNRVINNGPLRIISRTGQLTIYHDLSASGNFADPNSFRDGDPILVADVRQQVILNTLSGAFSAGNQNTITSRSPFQLGDDEFVLGRLGGVFRTIISGQQASTSPPSAYMAGYTFSTRRRGSEH